MTPPNSEQIITQLVALTQAIQVYKGVGDIDDSANYEASKAVVFPDIPIALVPGENPDVLRSSQDELQLKGGKTQERVNAFCFDEKSFAQTPPTHDNVRGVPVAYGERMVTYVYRIWYFYQWTGSSKTLARRYVEALRKTLQQSPKLGFASPFVNFIEGHGELQTVNEDLHPFDECLTHLFDMELEVRVTEPQ